MTREPASTTLAERSRGGRLGTALDHPASKRVYVRRLFATIADRYDLITVLLSFGLDRGWKRRLVSRAGPLTGRRALDLACGTGDISFELSDRGASVVGLDVTHRMVQIANSKVAPRPFDKLTVALTSVEGRIPSPEPRIPSPEPRVPSPEPRVPSPDPRTGNACFLVGDMLALPFGSEGFDIVTIGYGLRNVPVLMDALSEIRRVLRPGGLLLSLDFNRPENGFVRNVYLGYLTVVGSTLGVFLHRDPDTYRYIPQSIKRYPGAAAVAQLMRDAGFARAEWIPVLGGLMAFHIATK